MRRPAIIRALLFAVLVAAGNPQAFAHAVLLSSDPQDGAALAQSPKSIQLTFDEPVQLTRLQAVKSDGTVVVAMDTWPQSQTITWTLPTALADGGWLLSYAVISADSHPVSGTIRFGIGDGDITFGEAPAAADTLTEYPRTLLLAGTLAGVGLLFAGALFRRSAARGTKVALTAALAAALLGSVGLVYATAVAAGGGGIALSAAFGILGPGMGVLLAALAAGSALAWYGYRRSAALCGVVALIGLGLSGHVAGAPPDWLSRPIHLVHVSAVAVWLGSLFVLLSRRRSAASRDSGTPHRGIAMAPPGGGSVLERALASEDGPMRLAMAAAAGDRLAVAQTTLTGEETPVRTPSVADTGETNLDPLSAFSRLAPWLVAVLVACGLTLLAIQAGNPDILANSRYGILIGIKIFLVMVLLAVAALNRWRLTRPVLAGDRRGERRMRVMIAAEIALFVPILALTALLGTTIPPRSLAAAAIPPCSVAGPLTRAGSDIGLDVTLTFQSACSGRNNISLSMKWHDGRPLSVQEVMLQFSQPALNIEPFDVYLGGSGGSFSAPNYALPLGGQWQVETRILVDEYSLRRVVFRIPLAAS